MMINIFNIINSFPVIIDEYNIRVITYEDIDRYSDILNSDWYNENLEYKFNIRLKKTGIVAMLKRCINMYNKLSDENWPVRTIMTDSENNIIAGVTIAVIDCNSIELAYWVEPSYQNNGIAKLYINKILHILYNINDIDKITATIKSNNTASIKVVESNGFKFKYNINGVTDILSVYEVSNEKVS